MFSSAAGGIRDYRRRDAGYLKRSLSPLKCEYTQPIAQDTVQVIDAEGLENLLIGLDGTSYRWTDLYGKDAAGLNSSAHSVWSRLFALGELFEG